MTSSWQNQNGGSGTVQIHRIIEVLTVLLLAIATVGSAWCAYQVSQWNGIETDAVTIARTSSSSGEDILQHCEAWGADLLIKGAYTQSRLRQMIFGGATSHVLAHARLPVFMAH